MANQPYRVRIFIIVPAGIVQACNNDAKGWDAVGGEFTFTTGLTNNPPGQVVAYMAETKAQFSQVETMKTTVLNRAAVKSWCEDQTGNNDSLVSLFNGMSNVTVGVFDVNAVLTAEGYVRVNFNN